MIMELLPQSLVEYIYNNFMNGDFHPSEVKPYEQIMKMIETDNYECYGFYEKDELLGYGFMRMDREWGVIYLDYLAVLGHCRRKGHGNTILSLIYENFKSEFKYLVAEVEDPDYSENASDLNSRQGRVNYYLKNNLVISGVKTRVQTDYYKIIYLSLMEEPDDMKIEEYMKMLYIEIFGQEYFDENIEVQRV